MLLDKILQNFKNYQSASVVVVVFMMLFQAFSPAMLEATTTPTTTVETGDGLLDVEVENNTNENTTQSTSTPTSTDPFLMESELEVENDNESDVNNGVDGQVNTGENEAETEAGDAVVNTGDAEGEVYVGNTANTNTTGSLCGTTEAEIDNNNTSTTTNTLNLDGGSGNNTSTSSSSDALVDTGDVDAEVDVSNNVNTNVAGDGQYETHDLHGDTQGDLDLSGFDEESTQPCGDVVDKSLEIENDNDGLVENNVEINGDSGNNTASSTAGVAEVTTGDVNVTANVANVVNTNITGNGWFYAVINIFGNWNGDLILPNTWEEAMENEEMFQGGYIQVENDNEADVENNVNILAESGNNTASGTQSLVVSGDATAEGKVVNQLNTNIFGDFWDLARINVFGQWSGEIYGLPENASWIELPGVIIIYNTDNEEIVQLIDAVQEELDAGEAEIELENSNNAKVVNNVTVTGNSGGNTATGELAAILTGNVKAQVNIFNQVNTNLSGNGWLFSLINVFGNWQGNLEFGRPDLWINESIEVEANPLGVGGQVTFTFEFGNNGDGIANNVKIFDYFATHVLSVIEDSGAVMNNGKLEWRIGNLLPGQTGSLSYTSEINSNLPLGTSKIFNTVLIGSAQEDRNFKDNISGGDFLALNDNFPINRPSAYWPPYFALETSSNYSGTLEIGDIISFKAVLLNTGDMSASRTLVESILLDSFGNEIATNHWDLGTVSGGEEITITYDVEMLTGAPEGSYTSLVTVKGWDANMDEWVTDHASTNFEVNGIPKMEWVILNSAPNWFN